MLIKSVRMLTIVAAGTAVAGLGAGIAFATTTGLPPLWSETREVGAPINGHWFASDDGGCFGGDGLVYRFDDDQQAIISKGIEITFGGSLVSKIENQRVVLDMEIPLARKEGEARRQYGPAHFEFLDKGSELQLVAYKENGVSAPGGIGLTVGDLKRCGTYSWWGRVSLLWRPAFQIGEAKKATDPDRD